MNKELQVNRKIEAYGETLVITAVGKTAVLAEVQGYELMVAFEDIEDVEVCKDL